MSEAPKGEQLIRERSRSTIYRLQTADGARLVSKPLPTPSSCPFLHSSTLPVWPLCLLATHTLRATSTRSCPRQLTAALPVPANCSLSCALAPLLPSRICCLVCCSPGQVLTSLLPERSHSTLPARLLAPGPDTARSANAACQLPAANCRCWYCPPCRGCCRLCLPLVCSCLVGLLAALVPAAKDFTSCLAPLNENTTSTSLSAVSSLCTVSMPRPSNQQRLVQVTSI